MVVASFAFNPKSSDDTDRDSTHARWQHPCGVLEYEPDDARPRCPESEANTELSRPIGNPIGQQSVKADCRQREGKPAEHRRHSSHQTFPDQTAFQLSLERADAR